jgi:pimeloyl-ACP methyl ester carboxylesterase
MPVRALFRAIRVSGASAPYDTLTAKIYYPAQFSGSHSERNFGVVEPAAAQAPFPVIIFLNGVNGPPETYQWLLAELVELGFVGVTYSWVTDQLPGGAPGLTPGVDLEMLRPDTYGKGPTCQALAPIFRDLAALNKEGLLAGLLDLERVALGGHSAGGSAALINANPRFFPQVKAAFTYGAHVQAATALGHAPGSAFRLTDELPLLIMGGNRDGVIAASSGRYKEEGEVNPRKLNASQLAADAMAPLLHTFQNAISGARGDRFLAILDGANHFSIAYPQDLTTGRGYLDQSPTRLGVELRTSLLTLIRGFLQGYVLGDEEAKFLFTRRFALADEQWPLMVKK